MNRIDSDENIFDPEIIYYITKIIIEPFITCNYDRDKYKNGEDCVISFDKSSDKSSDNPKYLCVSFGEELLIDNSSIGIIKKGNHKSLGTIFIFDQNGGSIILKRPLTNISSLYYSYIHTLNELHDFKKTILISDFERKEHQSKTIYISNVDKIIYKEDIHVLEIDKTPIGKWNPSKDEYPNQIEIKGFKCQDSPLAEIMSDTKESLVVESSSDFSDNMGNSLPNIDDEIVNNIRPLSSGNNPLDQKHPHNIQPDVDDEKCCCIKYFFNCFKSNKLPKLV